MQNHQTIPQAVPTPDEVEAAFDVLRRAGATLEKDTVLYGPVGHPLAQVWDVPSNFSPHSYLAHCGIQGQQPTLLFDDDKSLAEQGYYEVPAQVAKYVLAIQANPALVAPRMFTPVPVGVEGRTVLEFKDALPSYCDWSEPDVWAVGSEACDHDIGLEAMTSRFLAADGSEHESDGPLPDDWKLGAFYQVMTCARCGARHAYQERSGL